MMRYSAVDMASVDAADREHCASGAGERRQDVCSHTREARPIDCGQKCHP